MYMTNFHDSSMYFESKSTDTKKIFTIKFPFNALHGIDWDEKELKKLAKYERSSKVSDKLLQLSLIAKKIEEVSEEY